MSSCFATAHEDFRAALSVFHAGRNYAGLNLFRFLALPYSARGAVPVKVVSHGNTPSLNLRPALSSPLSSLHNFLFFFPPLFPYFIFHISYFIYSSGPSSSPCQSMTSSTKSSLTPSSIAQASALCHSSLFHISSASRRIIFHLP